MDRILYYVGGLLTFLPIIFILDFPILLTVILCSVGFFLNMFALLLPFPALVYEGVFWVWGLIVLFNRPFSLFSVIAVLVFLYWIVSNVFLLIKWFKYVSLK